MSAPISDLQQTNNRYRAMLLAREASATQTMGRAYKDVWDAIEPRILTIAEEADPSPFKLMQQERYRTLQTELALRMEVVEERVYDEVVSGQRFGVRQGRESALRQIEAVYGDMGREMAELVRLPTEQLGDLIGNLQDGSPLRDLLHELGPDARRRIEQGLIQGITLGENPRVVARRVRDAFGGNLSRAMTVSRTEMLRAQRSSQLRHFQENSHAVAQVRWQAALDNRTCMACTMLHGQLFNLDMEPGNHPNCFIGGTVVSGPKVIGSTARWYSGPVVEVETSLGHRFTVTPNHPILTPHGWVAAGLLHEGSDVVSAPLGERPIREIDPDEYNVPALIEDVSQTFGGAGTMTPVSMPTTAMDFHGDGAGSEISIVRTDGLLRDTLNATVKQPSLDQQFSRTNMRLPSFSAERSRAELFKRVLHSTNGIMRSDNIPPILFGRSCRHHKTVSSGRITTFNTSLFQSSNDNGARNTETVSDGFLGLTRGVAFNNGVRVESMNGVASDGDIVLSQHAVDRFIGDTMTASEFRNRYARAIRTDKVVQVRRIPEFSGHVYNLHTKGGWYIANGIIAHNCRCVLSPVPPNSRLQIQTGDDWFRQQDEETQRSMMGDRKYEAWQEGRFDLPDLVAERDDRRWGKTRSEASLKQLLGRNEYIEFMAAD